MELDLRLPFGHLAALVRQVLQRRRVIGAEETGREEGAEGKHQGDEGKDDDWSIVLEGHLRRVKIGLAIKALVMIGKRPSGAVYASSSSRRSARRIRSGRASEGRNRLYSGIRLVA